MIAAPAADAAGLPNPVCLVGVCDEINHIVGGKVGSIVNCALAAVVCAGKKVVGGVAGLAGGVVEDGVNAVGGSVMGGLTSWVAEGAAWLVSRVGTMLDRSTRPALGSTWFTQQYRTMIELAVSVALAMLLAAVIHATLRQDIAMLLRAALVALPTALCLCFAAVTLVEMALGVTDWMTDAVLQSFETDTGNFFKDIGHVLAPTGLAGAALPSFLLFLSGLFTALMTFMVWLELVMREAAIYVAVAFLPLSFAAMIWRATAHWCRRLVEGLMAIILSKFTIAAAIALAASAMSHAGGDGDGGWTALLAGSAVMLIAALTPALLLKIVPFAETATQVGLQRGAARGAVTSAPGAQSASMVVRLAMAQTFASTLAGGSGNGAARALPPAPTPATPSTATGAAGSQPPGSGRQGEGASPKPPPPAPTQRPQRGSKS